MLWTRGMLWYAREEPRWEGMLIGGFPARKSSRETTAAAGFKPATTVVLRHSGCAGGGCEVVACAGGQR